jgi:ABC-type branched-subunit amino acid transport system ATPase component
MPESVMRTRHGGQGVQVVESALPRAEQLRAGYGPVAVVHGIDLEVRPGEGVAWLALTGRALRRSVFMGLTREENLKIGRGDVSAAVALFQELRIRWRVKAGPLSGGSGRC